MLINRDELKAQMVRKHISRDELATTLCISLRSLDHKIVSNKDFKEKEICTLVGLFGTSIFDNLHVSVFRGKGRRVKSGETVHKRDVQV